MKTRAGYEILLLAMLLTGEALAQSGEPARADDPVKRAQEKIEATVNARVINAERAVAASKLINEGVEARKQGKRDEARASLQEAAQQAALMLASSSTANDVLTEELLRRIAAEQSTLNPPATLSLEKQGKATGNLPRLVLARYHSHRDTLKRILAEEGVPIEALSVALIESGFNPFALSPKGARGIWQFMPATAQRYGLIVDRNVDQRTHPELSTRAAARYLLDLYQQFGDWKLALAAYNSGEARVHRIIKQTGLRDFDEMARHGLLPLETRNYVPAVLAAWQQFYQRSTQGKE